MAGYGYRGRPYDYPTPQQYAYPQKIVPAPRAQMTYAPPPQISYGVNPYQLSHSATGVQMNYNSPSGDGPIYRLPADRFHQQSQHPDFSNLKPGDVFRVKEVNPMAAPTYYTQPSSQPVRVVHDPYYGY